MLPDVEEIKTKFMERLTSQLEGFFESSEPSAAETADIIDATKNSTLDDKDKILNSVKQNTDKIRQELSDLIQSTWNQRIAEIKQAMKTAEASHKSAQPSDAVTQKQLDSAYRQKMDDLSRQLDQQQREKQRQSDSIQKTIISQETRIKSLETEL